MIIALSKVSPGQMDERTFKAALRLLIGASGQILIPQLRYMHVCAQDEIKSTLIKNIAGNKIILTP